MRKLAIGAVFLALAACGEPEPVVQQDTPPLYKYASIKAAIADAQSTVNVFWEHQADPGAGESDFRVKVTQETEDYLRDFVWVEYLEGGSQPGEWRGSVGIENGGNERFPHRRYARVHAR